MTGEITLPLNTELRSLTLFGTDPSLTVEGMEILEEYN